VSRASRKSIEVEEDENRPFSQAHEDPETQVEIERDDETETEAPNTDERRASQTQAKDETKTDDNVEHQ